MTSSLTQLISHYKSLYPTFEADLELERLSQELTLQLIEIRLESGLNQSQFAKQVGMKQSHLSRLEKGTTNPTIQSLERIAQQSGYHLSITFEHQ